MSETLPSKAELEAIEQSAWRDMFAAAPAAFVDGAGLASQQFGDAAAFAIRMAPAIQFNHAHGPTVGEDAAQLDAVLAWLGGHCGPVWAVQTIDGESLEGRGLGQAGSWTKFMRAPVPAQTPACGLRLAAVGAEGAQAFGATVQQAFSAPPPFALWAAALAGRPGWTSYLAYDSDRPVAAGALFQADGMAWLGLGGCLEEARGRGAQKALLARRIEDAIASGARWLVTETGTPAPGQEADHPSWRNILRAGFEPAYARRNWKPAS